MADYKIQKESDMNRFALYDGNKEIGELTWTYDGKDVSANHTFVTKSYGGQGLAAQLLDELVKDARENDYKIIPVCPYIAKKFEESPEEYADVWKK